MTAPTNPTSVNHAVSTNPSRRAGTYSDQGTWNTTASSDRRGRPAGGPVDAPPRGRHLGGRLEELVRLTAVLLDQVGQLAAAVHRADLLGDGGFQLRRLLREVEARHV